MTVLRVVRDYRRNTEILGVLRDWRKTMECHIVVLVEGQIIADGM
jgi:hypothetical protein